MDTDIDAPYWRLPALSQNRLVGGVAAGIAEEVGVDALVIRVAFVVLVAAGGWGVLLYGVAWGVLASVDTEDGVVRVAKGRSDTHRLVGVGGIVLGLLLFADGVADALFIDSLVWPIALFAAGVAVAQEQGIDLRLGSRSAAAPDRSAFLVRVAGGAMLVLAGVVLAVSLNFDFTTARNTVLVVGIVIAGLALVTGPWIVGLVNDLTAERRARIRADERAEVAAHLHDSVLQTLALIQRRADDAQVVSLARQQERELRSWLYGRRGQGGAPSFRDALETEAGEVEARHSVPVEVVVVGDGPVDEEMAGLLAAVREAITNAAVHAQAPAIDVFAEVTATAVDVFVRDAGVGFDQESVPTDRRGLADSIVGRIERLGGSAAVTTELGQGTEVEIHLPRSET